MNDTKKCPYCAEDIKAAAIKCRFCGEMLGSPSNEFADLPDFPEPPREKDSQGNPTILAALLFLVGIGVFAYGMAMDTTVATEVGRVANIHLGQQQTMYLIVGALAVAGGFGVAYSGTKK